jgi:hypothetical protein
VLIDCDSCEVRGLACGDCVVTVLLGAAPADLSGPPGAVDLDADERRAIGVLADSGLVPPLRLVVHEPDSAVPDAAVGRRRAAG